MEKFKIKHFEDNNPAKKFPWFRSLNSPEVESIRQKLSEKLGLTSRDPQLLTDAIDKRGTTLKEFDSNEEFQLSMVLSHLNIQPEEKVFINWYLYNRIDEIGFSDLNNYFSDIWYPGPDDIDVFDSSLSWIISISHEGYIKLVRIPRD